jgi:hypothetical protein
MTSVEQRPLESHAVGQTRDRWFLALLIALALFVPAFTIFLKLNALYNWRYTSDLFVIDTMLQETLRGHFMMEYTYGCQFGDHACLILLLAVPIKWIIGSHMTSVLVLVSPVTQFVCGIDFFTCIRAVAGMRWAIFATVLFFLSLGSIHGPFEFTWGFHIDTISGFVLVALAAILLRREICGPARWVTVSAIVTICIFALLKEEMALLGGIFFTILLIRKRDPLYIGGLLICIAIFAIEMLVIRVCRTQWNRTNGALAGNIIHFFGDIGFRQFLFSRERLSYWSIIVTLVGIMVACVAISRRLNLFAAALLVTGLVKLAFAWSGNDFDLWAWHDYPAIVMLCGAIILQSLEFRHLSGGGRWMLARTAPAALLILFAGWFFSVEIPYAIGQARTNTTYVRRTAGFKPAMLDLKKHVDKSKVVSMPLYSLIEWTDGHRYAPFPGGITWNVVGAADYVIILRTDDATKIPELKVFVPIYQNGRYRLFARKGYLPGERESREAFIEKFGPDALGEKPKSGGKKKKNPPATSARAN